MATVYTASKYCSDDHLYYRVKCDYTTTNNTDNMVIKATFQLQYKGTYKNTGGYFPGANGGGTVDGNSITIPKQTPKASKSDWTNVGSSITRTITKAKETAEYNIYISFYVSVDAFNPAEKEVTIKIPALASYDVTYNANGGSGAPSTQKKYYGITLTLSSSNPTRNGYSFYHWNTANNNSGTSYNSGASYTLNAALALYAIWNPIIYYNGNGGTTSVTSQTKTYGTSLTLSSAEPTRSGYVFDSWNTAANGSGTKYVPSGTYTSNITATLYAQWKKLPDNPKISSMTAIRCDSTGDQDDEGTYAKVTVGWSVDTTSPVYPNNTGTVTGTIRAQNSSSSTAFTFSSGGTGTSGTAVAIISGVSTDEQYYITAKVTDQNSATSRTVILTRAFFIMDFKAGGKSVGLGRAAPQNECLEIGYDTFFDEEVTLYKDLTCANIKCGRITGTNVGADTYKDFTVTFTSPFAVTPVITATFETNSSYVSMGYMTVSVHSITTTGFTIRIYNKDTGSRNPAVNWIAMSSGKQ